MKKCELVLLIDDNDLDNYVNKSVIEKLDIAYEIKVLKNGLEAINYLKTLLEVDRFPDLIFLDLNMPVVNGFEFLKQYNALKKTGNKEIKIVVLTSSSSDVDYSTAKSLGCSAYLEKPLTKAKISEVYNFIFS